MNADFSGNRRAFLTRSAVGVGGLALSHLLARESARAQERNAVARAGAVPGRGAGAFALDTPHHPPRAKSVILLFQNGGPSQMDLFDPKPILNARSGQPYPGKVEAHFHTQVRNLLGSPFKFQKYGQCGMELSELLPHVGAQADHLTLVRSMKTDSVDHEQALRLIHSGSAVIPKASWGSWVVYGLGTEREELPAFVVLTDPGGLPIDGTKNWSSGFLPAACQGTEFRSNGSPVLHLTTPGDVTAQARRNQLDFLETFNSQHRRRHPERTELTARIANFELAARMQLAAPAALDIERETEATRRLYGLDQSETADYGRRCLMARRLIEQGVRFVGVYMNGQPWDTHSNNAKSLEGLCRRTDRPSAALVADLKQRGLLEDTLVMWAGEFGRLPVSQGADGRDHNRHAFSLWIAGGGFKAGHIHGATDEFGYASVDKIVTVHDLHATLLHALGLNHEQLTFPHEGRDETLTDILVSGASVVDELFA